MSKNKPNASAAANAPKKPTRPPASNSPSLLATDPKVVELLRGVQQHHDAAEKVWKSMAETIRTSITNILSAGQLLTKVKSLLEHGEFEKAIDENCTLSKRQVQRYMKLFHSQAILDAIDKDWRQKFTLVEALEAVREYELAKAEAAIDADRSTQAESREKKVVSKPTAKVAARSKRRVGKAPTPSSVRSLFKVALHELDSFHERIEVIKKPETLVEVEVGARRMISGGQTLLEECKKQRVALKKPLKAKATSKSSLKPTAKSVRVTRKSQKSGSRNETEPTKA